MRRILRTELRRSSALGVGLVVLVIGMGLLYLAPGNWAGSWMGLAVTHRMDLILLWSLALAGGAWQVRRERRSRVDELFASVARPRWQRLAPTAVAVALTAVVAYLAAFLAGAVRVAPTASYYPPGTPLVLAVGALSMIPAVWIGMAVGRALPYLVTAPALAVVAAMGLLGVPIVFTDPKGHDPRFVLLSPVLSTPLGDLVTVAGRIHVAHTVWLVCVAAAGFGLLVATTRRGAALAATPVLLGAAVALPMLPTGGNEAAFRFDPAAAQLVCAEGAPRVCVRKVHARLLPDVTPPARQALALLAKLPEPPTAVVEAGTSYFGAPSQPYTADTVQFYATFDVRVRLRSADEFVQDLLTDAFIRPCDRTDPDDGEHSYVARRVVAAWLTGKAPAPDPNDRAGDAMAKRAYQELVALPPAEQRARVAAARRAALTCEGKLYEVLTEGAR
ncbi:hypothetical protein HC031_13300 [Planosporangium thailandense]|uniref:ABC transporter permease n=1 Tax=Planosporangium thailandense TaxID=765197 RepID=A0ABX0XXA8_9ACTN|nr:hypothetical protein [Planosporangium thailandense]NJC70682.1 hypothetical protein [Planosporangium thailandense]